MTIQSILRILLWAKVLIEQFLYLKINRTSPRTQAALLQAMEEKCVSEDGKTYKLESPFMVIATQNPYGSAGTMPLPNSQLDRFMMKISLGRSPCQISLPTGLGE